MAMDTSSRPDISPEGDVIFLVGPVERRLRVSSHCLKHASKVFTAMFGPIWSEGQNLSPLSPREVPLPDDDPEAMRVICCVLHHRNDQVPERLDPTVVLNMAIAVDKYDLGRAFSLLRPRWLEAREEDDLSMRHVARLMAAACVFYDARAFADLSSMLILDFEESYLSLLEDEQVAEILPSKTIHRLEEQRSLSRATLMTIVYCGSSTRWCCFCEWGKDRNHRCQAIEAVYSPMRALETPLSEIIRELEKIPMEEAQNRSGAVREECRRAVEDGKLEHGYISGLFGYVKGLTAKLCLDCLRFGGDPKRCRIEHFERVSDIMGTGTR